MLDSSPIYASVPASDLQRAKGWYEDKFGFSPVAELGSDRARNHGRLAQWTAGLILAVLVASTLAGCSAPRSPGEATPASLATPATVAPSATVASSSASPAADPNFVSLGGGDVFGDIAAGGGWIWAATVHGLLRVDPTDLTITRYEGIGRGKFITYAFDSIWVGAARTVASAETNVVHRIDPENVEVLATISVPGMPEGVAATEDGVWVTQHQTGSISRIDPATNELAETIVVGKEGARGPTDPAAVDGDIWFGVPNEEVVIRLDPERTAHRHPTPGQPGYGPPTATSEAIWLTNWEDLSLTRIDRATGETTFPTPSHAPGGAATAGVNVDDTLWILTDIDMLALDSRSAEVMATVRLRGGIPRNAVVFDDAVWIMSEFAGSIERIPIDQLPATE